MRQRAIPVVCVLEAGWGLAAEAVEDRLLCFLQWLGLIGEREVN
jgi:hypothetical protein